MPFPANPTNGDLWAEANRLYRFTSTLPGWELTGLPAANRSFNNLRIIDLALPIDPGDGTNKQYVDTLATGAQQLVGVLNGTTGQAVFDPASGIPNGTLPLASTVSPNDYVMIDTAGTPPVGPPETRIPLEIGDWLIAAPTQWIHLPVGGATATGGTTSLNPPVFGETNVQDALEQAELEVDAKVERAGDTMTGNLGLPNGTLAAPALALGAADGTGFSRIANAVALSVQGNLIGSFFPNALQFNQTMFMLNNRVQQVADATAPGDALNMRTGDLRYAPFGLTALVPIGPIPPPAPDPGQLWWRNDPDANLYIYYDDGTTEQWVAASPGNGGGGTPLVEADPLSLHLTGGTLTGPLILSRDPQNVMEAATRQYVDAIAGGAPPNAFVDRGNFAGDLNTALLMGTYRVVSGASNYPPGSASQPTNAQWIVNVFNADNNVFQEAFELTSVPNTQNPFLLSRWLRSRSSSNFSWQPWKQMPWDITADAGAWQTTGLTGVAANARYRLLNGGTLLQYMASVTGQNFTGNATVNLGTLPAGFRPARDQIFTVYAILTATGTTFAFCEVFASGAMYYVAPQNTQAFNISIIVAMG